MLCPREDERDDDGEEKLDPVDVVLVDSEAGESQEQDFIKEIENSHQSRKEDVTKEMFLG